MFRPSEQVAGQIVLVQTLHHDDYDALFLAVQPADQSVVVPRICRIAFGSRKSVIGLQGIVKNDDVPPAAGEYPSHRGSHPKTLGSSCKVVDGLFVGGKLRLGKQSTIEGTCHQSSTIPGQLVR